MNRLELHPDAMQLAPELTEVQGMMPISADDRARLEESIKEDGVRDPVKGYFDEDGIFNILSGANRWDIAKHLGKMVPYEIVDPADREQFAVDENLSRRHLTTEQKRKLVAYLLTQNPEASDRQIGKLAGVSKNTSATVRAHLQSRGQIDHVTKKDTKGRTVGQKPGKKSSGEIPQLKKPPKKKSVESDKKAQLRALKSERRELEKKAKAIKAQISKLDKQISRLGGTTNG